MRSVTRGLVVALAAAALAGSARAADDAALRKKALGLNEITGKQALQGQVLAMLEDPTETRKLLKVAAGMAKEKPQPFNLNATIVLAALAEDLKDVDTSAAFYKLHAEQGLKLLSGRALSTAYAGLIQLYFENKKYDEAEKACREFLGIKGDESIERLKPTIIRSLVLTLVKKGDAKEANRILDALLKDLPDNWLNLALRAQVYQETGQAEDAAKAYLDVIEKVKNDKRLDKDEDRDYFVDKYRYALSGVYVDLNQIDKAAEQLKALLKREPDNSTYNNDLGYIWADHDMNLDESERLIRKAIEEDRKERRKASPDLKQEKDNPAYLDSLGWVLFKQKKYKEAKKYLEEAVQAEQGKHLEIYDHLGEVHKALGEKAAAVKAWKAGLKVAGTTPRDKQRKAEVEKKLKANE
ncbi:MAG TPA: tetratricopeptide repeat protein [Gemmataceae bacterium]|nr:tetratricopeptide repeat protein [Gemmataceae bacterium]